MQKLHFFWLVEQGFENNSPIFLAPYCKIIFTMKMKIFEKNEARYFLKKKTRRGGGECDTNIEKTFM